MHIDVAARVFYISGMKQNSHPSDPDRLLQAALRHAAFDGWTDEMVRQAGTDAGLSSGAILLAAPRGALDLIAHWSRQMDQQMRETMAAADLKSMKIRQRVTFAVQARLDAIGPHEEAARRARARLMLHDAASLGAELIWATSDDIWRALNDPSTDFNWYSKRAILSAVYTSSLAVWLNDETPDKMKAKAFLDRRIENVMEFEKAKASWRKLTADLPDPAQILSGLRYGGRRRA
ncbi:COQ9 family protein [Hyphobacterium indicum]|uniref:COQ9 family protein n=1 Tax=Hyphobacterium indicum TaxID=2162714 RepID=UPI001F36E3C4|nr:COQ9 family protein [Hyphobacterium indicum]